MSKNSIYEKGRKCSCCGIHLDSSDSYSIKFNKRGRDIILCNDCDRDANIPQKPYYKEE
jgi:hypothetical protein